MSEIYEHADSVAVFLRSEDQSPCSQVFDFFDALRVVEECRIDSVLKNAHFHSLGPVLAAPSEDDWPLYLGRARVCLRSARPLIVFVERERVLFSRMQHLGPRHHHAGGSGYGPAEMRLRFNSLLIMEPFRTTVATDYNMAVAPAHTKRAAYLLCIMV
jgi:hypothetical protein